MKQAGSSGRCCTIRLAVAVAVAVSGQAIASGDTPPPYATAGLRMGDSTVEGFGDVLIPLGRRGDSLFFVNPRFSIKDEGETEANVGVVWRRLLPGGNAIVGANAYFDSRESKHGNRFNQFGAGVEVLGKWVDARVNWYDADNDPELVRETATREIETRSSISTSKVVSTATSVSETTRYGDPYATGHTLLQDVKSIRATTNATTTQLTTTTRTATTTTERLFQEFEAGLDGYDAEIGVRLPFGESGPEVRVFVGRYDFEGELGREVKGDRARLEVRAGPYLTFDAEWFEDVELNGTDYFVGARLHVPLYDDGQTWKRFREGFRSTGRREFADRQYTDMVMRDVRVQMEESGPLEDVARRRQETSVEVSSRTTSSTNTETESEVVVEGAEVVRDDITFVDGDNDGGALEDGTFENPNGTIGEGVAAANATGNDTIFLCGAGDGAQCDLSGGAGAYDERVTLMENQTLTSSIEANGGMTFRTTAIPTIAPTSGGNGDAVLIASGNNVIHRIVVDATSAPEVDGIRVDAPDVTVSENFVTTRGGVDSSTDLLLNGVGIRVVSGGVGAVDIVGNEVVTDDLFAPGIEVDNSGNVATRIERNDITTRAPTLSPAIIAAGAGAGDIVIQGNTITIEGSDGVGHYSPHAAQTTAAIMVAQSGSGGTTIAENEVSRLGGGYSVSYLSAAAATGAVSVSRNVVTAPLGGGIFTENQGFGKISIDSNDLTTSAAGVATFNDGAGDTLILGNVVDTGATGIAAYNQGSGDTVITGNSITAEGDGLSLRSGHASLPTTTIATGNTVISSQGIAISVTEEGNECLVISDNTIAGGPDSNDYELHFLGVSGVEVSNYADLAFTNTFPGQTRIGTLGDLPVDVVNCP
ncbi:MAG: hypothetical protein DWQ08_07495 [Proteobacteria bacterium]|nr:MAG: hypothetical protein DWQ08_07495 [Pseudomonadota bacterium]